MDARSEIREFLTSRRGRLKAADVGLSDYGTRRVPGLRREEVAVLAGVSVPYYTRLERGDVAGVSDSVLDALARALRLDDAERAHLFDPARAVEPLAPPPRRRPPKQAVPPPAAPSPHQAGRPPCGAADHRRDGRSPRRPGQRTPGLRRRQRACPHAVSGRIRWPRAPELGAVHLPRPPGPRFLPRLGL